jgi:hypothetical protein
LWPSSLPIGCASPSAAPLFSLEPPGNLVSNFYCQQRTYWLCSSKMTVSHVLVSEEYFTTQSM